MRYNHLGNSGIQVSAICLGTMTFGEQNTEEEGHHQLDCAIEHGINFIDTAELYAIPPKAETYGRTEEIIGSWLAKHGHRDDLVIASKIAGPGADWVSHIRGGKTRFNSEHIPQALEASLKRLQTDYLDLYQLHWPERQTNYFGRLGYQHPDVEESLTPIRQALQALETQVKAGKIRAIGLSNETPWGLMQFLSIAKDYDLPKIVSVQNPYSLINRSFEVGCAEISHREDVGLLAYSPLGFGVLSGKYLNGAQPDNARITLWPDYARYINTQAVAATEAYVKLAHDNGLEPSQMALAYVSSRPFVASTIIGATTMAQLKTNITSINVQLDDNVLAAIDNIHVQHPNPAP
ncbi:MAG: NADP(H)-dependent aldo-keto reductase [Gammaproteobacteria bacterium]|nr:MAG: NADP(H)-dependent aldo-keto reductase [Gammaproteobacteria bacterium]